MLMPPALSERVSAGVVILRVIFGLGFVLHGLSKAPEPFTWADHLVPGMPGFVQCLVVIAEGGGGLLLLLGLLSPLGALLIMADMFGAFLTSTLPRGGTTFVNEHAGAQSYEKNLVYFAIALGLLLTGPGRYSLDALLRRGRD